VTVRLDALNRGKSFAAAFSRRSRSEKAQATTTRSDTADNSNLLAEGEMEHEGQMEQGVRVEPMRGGGWHVTSAFSKHFSLEPNLEFKTSQFIRTAVYEALPPSLGYAACVLTEMVIFGHTLHESMCCASSRMLLPFPCPPGPLQKVFITVKGNPMPWLLHYQFFVTSLFWLPVLAVCFSEDVRHYIEPLELAPMVILQACRVCVLSCKYALLPTSFVADVGGMMYRTLSDTDVLRTLVSTGWNNHNPKDEGHRDLLRMELEKACLEADVDLSDTEINLGSTRAAMVVRMRALGVGERARNQVHTSPAVVSGKELLAALVDTYVAKAAPGWLSSAIKLIAILFALVSPVRPASVDDFICWTTLIAILESAVPII